MSFLSEKEVECAHCSFPNTAELWSVVNVNTDPDLKNLLFGGELNLVKCVSCREIFYADEFFLYHDKNIELLAFVFSAGQADKKEEWTESARKDFAASQLNAPAGERLNYTPVVVFGIDSLLDLIHKTDEMEIQSQIVFHLSQLHGFPIKKVKPATAREFGLPPILPFIREGHATANEAILAGITQMKTWNNLLHLYDDAFAVLTANPAMTLPFDE